ncbi:PhoH family protein [Kamptonema cortianum]|nr:PhoH family protein [Kamptonema cortianum]MDL5046209.1 PhoH family protein [Oscillatoria amoena NRMC-F 0135]
MPSEKSHEHIIEFDSARALESLYNGQLDNLRKAEQALSVTITTRDGWLKIEGGKKNVDRGVSLFEHLSRARTLGIVIRNQDFLYVLEALAAGQSERIEKLFSTPMKLHGLRGAIHPKTIGQREYVEMIRSKDVCFGVGPAGTGKTYLAVAAAISMLKEDMVRRIILTRPAVEAGESLGFLPGELQEKIQPYLRPLFDAISDMLPAGEAQKLMEKNIIEVAPLAYMRGRTLSHSFIILDEAQNSTAEQMFMFLTRIGPGSKCVVTGDITQTDLPPHKKSGLAEAITALQHLPDIGFQFFEERDVIRHELVAKIIRAYQRHREPLRPDDKKSPDTPAAI